MPVYTPSTIGERGIIVRGTGNAVNDTALLTAAVARLNAWGNGTLWIEGLVQLVGTYLDFLGAISFRGLGPDAELRTVDQSSPIRWNGSFYYSNLDRYAFSMPNARSPVFRPEGTLPTRGDWVMMYSDNDLVAEAGAVPHNVGGKQHPMELHRVYHQIGSDSYVESFIYDMMDSSPRYAVVPMYRNVVVEGIRFSVADGFVPSDYATFLTFKTCDKFRVVGCVFDREGMGTARVQMCGRGTFDDVSGEGIAKADGIYGFLLTTSNGVQIINSNLIGYRHAFTTAGDRSAGSDRWGTALNWSVRNCDVDIPPKGTDDGLASQTASSLDTHSEGVGEFVGNRVRVGGGEGALSGYGFNIRARDISIRLNKVVGYGYSATVNGGVGVSIYGPNCEVIGNEFDHLLYGIRGRIHSDQTAYCDGARIIGNRFRNIEYNAIRMAVGDNHTIDRNECYNCGQRTGTNPQATKAPIQIGEVRQYADVAFENGGTAVTYAGHPFVANQTLFFTNSGGGLPAEVTANTTYWVKEDTGANTFTISATRGGSAVSFSSAGTGTHTAHGTNLPGTGIKIRGNILPKDSGDAHDNAIETNSADESDVAVEGNVMTGYTEEFSDRYGHRAALAAAYDAKNTIDP